MAAPTTTSCALPRCVDAIVAGRFGGGEGVAVAVARGGRVEVWAREGGGDDASEAPRFALLCEAAAACAGGIAALGAVAASGGGGDALLAVDGGARECVLFEIADGRPALLVAERRALPSSEAPREARTLVVDVGGGGAVVFARRGASCSVGGDGTVAALGHSFGDDADALRVSDARALGAADGRGRALVALLCAAVGGPFGDWSLRCCAVEKGAIVDGPFVVENVAPETRLAATRVGGRAAVAAVATYEIRTYFADGEIAAIAALPGAPRAAPTAAASVGGGGGVAVAAGATALVSYGDAREPAVARAGPFEALADAGGGWCVGVSRARGVYAFSGDGRAAGPLLGAPGAATDAAFLDGALYVASAGGLSRLPLERPEPPVRPPPVPRPFAASFAAAAEEIGGSPPPRAAAPSGRAEAAWEADGPVRLAVCGGAVVAAFARSVNVYDRTTLELAASLDLVERGAAITAVSEAYPPPAPTAAAAGGLLGAFALATYGGGASAVAACETRRGPGVSLAASPVGARDLGRDRVGALVRARAGLAVAGGGAVSLLAWRARATVWNPTTGFGELFEIPYRRQFELVSNDF